MLRGNTEAMIEGVLEANPENLESLKQETLQLARLVEDLRTLSLAEAGHLHLSTGATDLADIVRHVVDGFQTEAATRRVSLAVELPDGLPLVEADADRTAQVLANLGSLCVYVVHGLDGIDEISISGPTQISVLHNGEITTSTIEPSELGINRASMDDLKVGSPVDSAKMIRNVLAGKKGPARDAVLVNAAAAFCVGGKAEDLREGMELAAGSIDAGWAGKALKDLVRISNEK